jgi:Family of unknown function (DUF6130)
LLRQPLQNEPPAKIIIDPPLAEPLSHGRVVIQYCTENLHIVPVFGLPRLPCLPEPADFGQKRMRVFRCSNFSGTTPGTARSWAMLANG